MILKKKCWSLIVDEKYFALNLVLPFTVHTDKVKDLVFKKYSVQFGLFFASLAVGFKVGTIFSGYPITAPNMPTIAIYTAKLTVTCTHRLVSSQIEYCRC